MISLVHIEAVNGAQETDVAFADEVLQGKATMLVFLGDGNDEAKVGPDELLLGDLVPRGCLAGN